MEDKKFALTSEKDVEDMLAYLRERYNETAIRRMLENKPKHITTPNNLNCVVNKVVHSHLGAATGDFYSKVFEAIQKEYAQYV